VDSFIRSTPAATPLFAYFAPFGPHKPPIPAERHAGDFAGLPPYRPPNYNEELIGDKPRWLRRIPPLTSTQQNKTDRLRANQLRALESVDDAVGAVVRALTDTGRLENTLILFMSDNGFSWGEHRWTNKKTLYEENIRVPLVVRWDAVLPGPRTDAHLVTNIDLAPTFAAAGGVAPASPVEGRSLLPLFTDPGAPWRSDFLIEHMQATNGVDVVVTYCAVRNVRYAYGLLDTGEEELYDLAGPAPDPYELRNQAKNPGYATILARLRAREQTLCDPVPPGFDPPGP
jgi:arylsulfatase A-like enzyme